MEIESIDRHVARRLLANHTAPTEELFNLLASLSCHTRYGHLMIESPLSIGSLPGVVQENGCLYLERSYRLLKQVEERVKSLLTPRPLAPLAREKSLTEEQMVVVEQALSTTLAMISGGPGTGKTYTAGWLVRLLFEQQKEKEHFTCALAAPTGKAARRLLQSIERVFSGCTPPNMRALTLHALIGRDASLLQEDLILVDESSMIDLQMMAKLLNKIKPTSRLILMGDPNQLPPVEEGSLFADLAIHGGKLTRSLRMKYPELLQAADSVLRGDMPHFDGAVVSFKELSNPFQDQKSLVRTALEHFPRTLTSPEDALEALDAFRLLSPQRKGPLGVDALNNALLQELSLQKGAHLPIPIMITKNDYRLGLFNGECGLMVAPADECRIDYPLLATRGAYALFPSDQGLLRYELTQLPPFTLAWCLSIHKSQGSEFSRVLITLPDGPTPFSRELLYTALTRAKEQAALWSTYPLLHETLSNSCRRQSGFTRQET